MLSSGRVCEIILPSTTTGCAPPAMQRPVLHPWLHPTAPLGRRTAVTKSARLWPLREIAGVAFVQFFTLHSALLTPVPRRSSPVPRVPTASGAGVWVSAFQSAIRNPQCFSPSLRTRNTFSRLGLQKQVSPGFRFSAPLLLIVYLSTAPKVIHNGVCTSVHVKNPQIRVKIGQKGDVFRQKAIKNERISSCPS